MAPSRNSPPYRLSLRLYIVFSLLMAVSAALSGLFLLYLARPFVSVLSSTQTRELTVLLFTGSAVAGALAAVGGLIVGLKFAGRIQGIVEKADALSHLDGATARPPVTTVRDELGALDAAVGRLTLSMDRFIRDSDILARLPEGMLLVDPAAPLVSRDASEKRRIREELRRADQLAFLGGMAARIAHEIRTPLAAIRGLLELLQSDLPAGDQRRRYIDRVLVGVDRQNRLVENLLTLSHPEPEVWQAVALPEALDELVGMLPRDPRLVVERGDPDAVPPVWGDPFRLAEVFTNLIENALEASPEGSTVRVRVESRGD